MTGHGTGAARFTAEQLRRGRISTAAGRSAVDELRPFSIDPSPGRAPRPERGFRTMFVADVADLFGVASGAADAVGKPTKPYLDAVAALVEQAANLPAQIVERNPPPLPTREPEAWENPRIPAGYTYLLQLIAHDLVDSEFGAAAMLHDDVRPENLRRAMLMLETIYGDGPESTPLHYWPGDTNKVPRHALALGRMGDDGQRDKTKRPFRDIARRCPMERPGGGKPRSANLTEPMIADPRNDDHAMLSQLVAFFHIAHNTLVGELEKAWRARKPDVEPDMRELFDAARLAIICVYRNIIVKDLLRRVLHPDIYQLYVIDGLRLTRPSRQTIPVEFTHGAFRFPHAMVRNRYQFNADVNSIFTIDEALNQNSTFRSAAMPLDRKWIATWSRFFPLGAADPKDPLTRPLFSRKLSWPYTPLLSTSTVFTDELPRKSFQTGGLVLLDLLSHAAIGALSVPALRRKIADRASKLGTFGAALAKLVKDTPRPAFPQAPGLTAYESAVATLDGIVGEDLPLPVHVLLEAAAAGGEHLGILGSVLAAETLLGVIGAQPVLDMETEPPDLASQLRKLGELSGLPELPAILSEPLEDSDWNAPLAKSQQPPRPASSEKEIATVAQFIRCIARLRPADAIPFATGAS
jgi:hypothetical protein